MSDRVIRILSNRTMGTGVWGYTDGGTALAGTAMREGIALDTYGLGFRSTTMTVTIHTSVARTSPIRIAWLLLVP